MGTFQLLKNCFMDEASHAALLNPDLHLLPELLRPIIGNEPFLHGESEYKGIDPAVRAMMTPDKRREADPQIRVLVYEILLLCARHKPSRMLLRSQAIYPILRHAHDAEKADSDPAARELDELLEQLVPFFILDEEDESHPEQVEAGKRKARVEQLKAMNAQESGAAAAESAEERKERLAKEAAAADKPVHYLGDELGDQVRRRDAASASAAAAAAAAAAPAVVASSVAPPRPAAASAIHDDDDFPSMEPLGAEEST
jgi:hypothetical protein